MRADEKALNCFSQIRAQMPTISALLGLWSSLRRPIGVGSSAVATHNLDFLVLFQPVLNRGCLAIRKQINNIMSSKIDNDSSIRFAASPRKIIYSHLFHLITR